MPCCGHPGGFLGLGQLPTDEQRLRRRRADTVSHLSELRHPCASRTALRGSGLTARPARAGWAFMCNARACDAPGMILSDTVRWVTSQLHHLRDGAAHPRLQSDPRHEHHGKQAAPSQDQCEKQRHLRSELRQWHWHRPNSDTEPRSALLLGNPAQELLEHSDRPQACFKQHRHDLAVEYFGQGNGDAVAARGLPSEGRRGSRASRQPAAVETAALAAAAATSVGRS